MIAETFFLRFNLDDLNNLNRLQGGLLMIAMGLLFIIIFTRFHKEYQNQGYKLFKPFRRKGKTQAEDGLFIILYVRSLLGVFAGYLLIIGGIISIVAYFVNK